jgi:hypothetical protein
MLALSFSHLSRGARCCQITIASHMHTSALYPRILHIHIHADEDSVSVSEGTGAEASGAILLNSDGSKVVAPPCAIRKGRMCYMKTSDVLSYKPQPDVLQTLAPCAILARARHNICAGRVGSGSSGRVAHDQAYPIRCLDPCLIH